MYVFLAHTISNLLFSYSSGHEKNVVSITYTLGTKELANHLLLTKVPHEGSGKFSGYGYQSVAGRSEERRAESPDL